MRKRGQDIEKKQNKKKRMNKHPKQEFLYTQTNRMAKKNEQLNVTKRNE